MSRCRFDRNMLTNILKERVKDDDDIGSILSYYPEDYRCHREAYHDGLCIFHSRKKPDNFQEELDKEIDRMLSDGNVKELDFTGCIFSKVNLSNRQFKKPVKFIAATFHQAYFLGATFNEADFSSATFHQKADFSIVTFHQKANFINTIFHQKADFSHATFKTSVTYLDITNKGILDFSFSIFEEHLYMKPKENGYIIFHMVSFKKPSEIKLINLSLDKVSFLNTDLNGVALIPNKDSKEILDEIILREGESKRIQFRRIFRSSY